MAEPFTRQYFQEKGKEGGKKGGNATKARYGREHYVKMGKIGKRKKKQV